MIQIPRAQMRQIAVLLLVCFANTALATDFTVQNTNDSGAGSLREIIETLATPTDRVLFNAGLAGGTIGLTADLTVTQDPIELQVGIGALTINNTGDLILNGATTLNAVTNADSLTVGARITGNGGIVKDGAGLVVLNGTNNAYTGATTINAGTLEVQGGGGIGDQSGVSIGTGGTLQVTTNEAIGSLAGSGIVNLAQNLNVGANNASTTYSGAIGGVGMLMKSGTGVLLLNQTNNYSGGTRITGGTLQVDGGTTLLDTGSVIIDAGGTLQLGGANETIGALSGAAGSQIFTTRGLTTNFDAITSTFSGVIDGGGGSLTKQGTGTMILDGANTYTGNTQVGAGILALAEATGNTIADTSAIVLSGTGTLRLDTSETAGSLAGVVGTTVNLQANTLTVGGTNANTAMGGAIIGAGGSLVKNGTGILRLTGANTYSGGTTVNQGTLDGDATGIQGNVLTATGTLVKFDQGVAGTFAGNITGGGQVAKLNGGNLTMTGTNSYTGGTVVAAGTLTGDTDSLQGAIANAASVVFDQAVNGTYTGVMSGAGSLTKQNAGTLTLTGANTFTGGTTITGGTLAVSTASLKGNVVDNSVLQFNQDAAGTFAGAISGTGSLVKAGAGNLTLSGANSYSGGTAVTAGTLTGTSTSLQGAIANATAVVFDQAVAGTYAGAISGAGTVRKAGAGTLKFTGANTYTGLTTVAAGRLEVDGSLAGDVDVLTGARLGGRGRINNLTVRGVLAPGNSIGTTTVAGNLTAVTGSSFDVEIDPAGNSDLVQVGGTATIQAGTTLNVISAAGTYAAGQTFTVLTAAGGITGAYTTVLDDLAFLDVSVLQDLNRIRLELVRNVNSIVTAPVTLNQRGVATTLGQVAPRANGDLGAVIDVIQPLDAFRIREALEQLGGELHADMPSVVLQDFTTVNHTLSRRLRTITPQWVDDRPGPALGGPAAAAAKAGAGAVASPYVGVSAGSDEVNDPWSAWAEGYGYKTEVNSDGNGRAFSFDGRGGLIGLDRAFGLRTMGGLYVGASNSEADISGRLDGAEIDSFRLGLYGRYEHECGMLTGSVSWADNDFDVNRRLTIGGIDRLANAKYGGHGVSAYVEASTHMKHQGWEIYPAASLQYTQMQSGGFGESGANSLNLIGSQVRTDSALASIGARVTYPTETSQGRRLVPELRARYMREMRDGNARLFTARLEGAPANAFTVVGADPGRDFAVLGAGLTYQTGDQTNVFVSYDAQLSDAADTHTGEAGVQMKF